MKITADRGEGEDPKVFVVNNKPHVMSQHILTIHHEISKWNSGNDWVHIQGLWIGDLNKKVSDEMR